MTEFWLSSKRIRENRQWIISSSWCKEKEKIQYGYVVKNWPGYPIPLPIDNDEPWKSDEEKVKYVPLQVKEGDLAVFLQGGAYEVMYQNEKYFIVLSHQS